MTEYKRSAEVRAKIGKGVQAAYGRRAPINAEYYRARIRTGMLISRLEDVGSGKVEASATSVQACIALLRKVLPDLATVEHTSEHGVTLRTIITGVVRAEDLANNTKTIEHIPDPSQEGKP